MKVVACSSIEERDHWLRCFRMIIEMRNLGIDAGKVNIFTFEQFRKYHLKVAARSFGLADD